jgi:hypothetical protein
MANTLIHDIEHHAKDKADIVLTLGLLFASELNPIGWQALHGGKGNNSWRIYLKQDGKPTQIWYFTGYHKGTVTVRNDYYWDRATQQIHMKTRTDVIRFVRQLKK